MNLVTKHRDRLNWLQKFWIWLTQNLNHSLALVSLTGSRVFFATKKGNHLISLFEHHKVDLPTPALLPGQRTVPENKDNNINVHSAVTTDHTRTEPSARAAWPTWVRPGLAEDHFASTPAHWRHHHAVDLSAYLLLDVAVSAAGGRRAGVVGSGAVQIHRVVVDLRARRAPADPQGVVEHAVELEVCRTAGTCEEKMPWLINEGTLSPGYQVPTRTAPHWMRIPDRGTATCVPCCWWPPGWPCSWCCRWCIPSGSGCPECGTWRVHAKTSGSPCSSVRRRQVTSSRWSSPGWPGTRWWPRGSKELEWGKKEDKLQEADLKRILKKIGIKPHYVSLFIIKIIFNTRWRAVVPVSSVLVKPGRLLPSAAVATAMTS